MRTLNSAYFIFKFSNNFVNKKAIYFKQNITLHPSSRKHFRCRVFILLSYLLLTKLMCFYIISPDMPENEATYAITEGGIADANE